jgi:antitoxin (DNA-binding transcriptional repressor) of toxin-antitoxin stability system
MDATILDLRYRMSSVLEALDRREEVRVLYHGKPKGRIVPEGGMTSSRVNNHPFFGSRGKDEPSVAEVMDRLRGGRYSAL